MQWMPIVLLAHSQKNDIQGLFWLLEYRPSGFLKRPNCSSCKPSSICGISCRCAGGAIFRLASCIFQQIDPLKAINPSFSSQKSLFRRLLGLFSSHFSRNLGGPQSLSTETLKNLFSRNRVPYLFSQLVD